MKERVDSEDIRIAMKLNPALEPFLLDLLNARGQVKELKAELKEAQTSLLWMYGETVILGHKPRMPKHIEKGVIAAVLAEKKAERALRGKGER